MSSLRYPALSAGWNERRAGQVHPGDAGGRKNPWPAAPRHDLSAPANPNLVEFNVQVEPRLDCLGALLGFCFRRFYNDRPAIDFLLQVLAEILRGLRDRVRAGLRDPRAEIFLLHGFDDHRI